MADISIRIVPSFRAARNDCKFSAKYLVVQKTESNNKYVPHYDSQIEVKVFMDIV
jgi:hypothetical protein